MIWKREANRDCCGRMKGRSDQDPRFVRLVASGLSVCSTQGKPKYVTQYVDQDVSTDLLSRKQSKPVNESGNRGIRRE